jgi:hypothetical protein
VSRVEIGVERVPDTRPFTLADLAEIRARLSREPEPSEAT